MPRSHIIVLAILYAWGAATVWAIIYYDPIN